MRHRTISSYNASKSALRGNTIGRIDDVKLVCRSFTFSLPINSRSKPALA